MSKKLIIIVLVAFVGSFGITFLMIRKYKKTEFNISEYIPITHNCFVGTINYNALESVVMNEMFRNPNMLMELKSSFNQKSFLGDVLSELARGGFDKDQKIIFSIPSKTKKEGFLLLAVTDAQKLKENISQHLLTYPAVKLAFKNSLISHYYEDEKVGVLLTEKFLCIAYAEEKTTSIIFKDIINQNNCYSLPHKKIGELINTESQFAIWMDNNSLDSSLNKEHDEVIAYLDFLDGELKMSGNILTQTTYFSTQKSKTYQCDTCLLRMHLNMPQIAEITSLFNDSLIAKADSTLQLFNLNFKDVFSLTNGQLDLLILGKGNRMEQQISYDFDNDFNKVEVIKNTPISTINFVLTVGSDSNKMYRQFVDRNIIKTVNNENLFTNPIGRCYAIELNNEILFTSNKTLQINKESLDTNGFNLFIDVDRSRNVFSKKINKNQFNFVKEINSFATQKDSVITFGLTLTSKNKDLNILFDFVKSFKENQVTLQ